MENELVQKLVQYSKETDDYDIQAWIMVVEMEIDARDSSNKPYRHYSFCIAEEKL